jgi:hypothetical protein
MFEEEFRSVQEQMRTTRFHRAQHYSRASFVAFLKFLQSRHRVNWLDLFRELVDLVSAKAPVSTKAVSVQELIL